MIGILSDAHGNRPAFDRAVGLLRSCGAESFVFLGDALGYLPACGVLDSLLAMGGSVRCVLGNHEDLLLRGGGEPQRDPVYQHGRIRGLMSEAQAAAIRSWPRSLRLELPAGAALFVHGSPSDPTYGYVYPDTDLSGFAPDADLVFMGHTHRPFIRRRDATTYVNVGSCGLPRDHGLLGSCALLDEATGAVRIFRFDIHGLVEQAMGADGSVHPSVLALSERQPKFYEGEFVGH